MQIRRLRLFCPHLALLKAFYVDQLGVALLEESLGRFSLQFGTSALEFFAGESGYYHFAFNISPNQIASAANWMESLGIKLLPFEGERIVQFPNWEAESIYFHDPAGNIVEFIARKRLPSSENPIFHNSEIMSISEIGFGTNEFDKVHQVLNKGLRIPDFGTPTKVFCALGDDHGLFILVDAQHKKWIPSMEPALAFPFEADIVQNDMGHRIIVDPSHLNITFSPLAV